MKDLRVIKVSKDNYIWLSKLAANLQKEKERPVSLDEALSEIKNKKTKVKLSSFAGMWKISDKEAEELKNNIRKRWGSWKIKFA